MRSNITNFLTRYLEKALFILAVILSGSSIVYYYMQGQITAYGDASSHLNIARRIVDNLNPGMAQLGAYWLPLLHLLMLPTIWIDVLWRTGLSGSIVNGLAYIGSVLFMFRLVHAINGNRFQALIGSLIVGLNLNFLYLQSTPMTEPLYIFTVITATYFLIKWAKNSNLLDLVWAATFFLLSSINRYESWSLVVASILAVGLVGYIRRGWKSAEGKLILYSTLASLGIVLWFVWQIVIFHDPLYFLNSEFSAESQTAIGINQGAVPTYHHITTSVIAYSAAIFHIVGLPIFVLFCVSIFAFLITNRKNLFKPENIVIFILLAPIVFEMYALYKGNVPISVPEVPEPSSFNPAFFNVRLGLYALPAVAIFISIISKKVPLLLVIFFLVLVNSAYMLPTFSGRLPVLADAQNSQLPALAPTVNWIQQNYKGGLILASAGVTDPIIRGSSLDIKNFITEGSGKYWNESMKNPAKYARYIILTTDPRDAIRNHANLTELNSNFKLVAQNYTMQIYEKI